MQRFISLLSLTALVTSLAGTVYAQTPPSQAMIQQVLDAQLMSRDNTGDFRADATISRAEMAVIMTNTFSLWNRQAINPEANVIDVPRTHWAYDEIVLVLQTNVMRGYDAERFYPSQPISRAEAYAIFAQAYGVLQFPDNQIDEILTRYTDADEVPSWARRSVATAVYHNFVNTTADNQIVPLDPMSRSDMAYALSIYLSRQVSPIIP